MHELVNIFIKAAFIENLILSYFLGMCSFLAVSKSLKTAFGLGLAVIFVLGITMPINWLINTYLNQPDKKYVGPAGAAAVREGMLCRNR